MPITGYENQEVSIENAEPIELYLFKYNGENFCYTSSYRYQYIQIGTEWYNFQPDYIKRGDSLKLGDSNGTVENCTITVNRTNNVALLYQGAPPEQDTVKVEVYRMHNNEYVRILRGIVSQVVFSGSEATLTITIENILSREIPVGKLSYFCQNTIYDAKCGLSADNYGLHCYIIGGHTAGFKGLKIESHELATKESGYFTNGYLVMGNVKRGIKEHKDNYIIIKYPINLADRLGEFMIYPGCDCLFPVCHRKFNNTDNFSGIPYIQPYDAFKHAVDNRPAYWVDDAVVQRDTKGHIHNIGV
nr:MAG TPA: minor tail protein [Caudoviricetes sp.]